MDGLCSSVGRRSDGARRLTGGGGQVGNRPGSPSGCLGRAAASGDGARAAASEAGGASGDERVGRVRSGRSTIGSCLWGGTVDPLRVRGAAEAVIPAAGADGGEGRRGSFVVR